MGINANCFIPVYVSLVSQAIVVSLADFQVVAFERQRSCISYLANSPADHCKMGVLTATQLCLKKLSANM